MLRGSAFFFSFGFHSVFERKREQKIRMEMGIRGEALVKVVELKWRDICVLFGNLV